MSRSMLTLAEVAQNLRISESMVRKLCASGRMVCVHMGRRILVEEADLNAFIDGNKTGKKVPA